MENKRQTAVQWFVDQLPLRMKNYMGKEIEQALQMERGQHGDTWDYAMKNYDERGGVFARAWSDFDDYYNETYGGKND